MDVNIRHGSDYLHDDDVEALSTPFRIRLFKGNVTITFHLIEAMAMYSLFVIIIISLISSNGGLVSLILLMLRIFTIKIHVSAFENAGW